MSNARAEVLARIAAIPRAAVPEPARDYRTHGSRSPDEVVQLFCDRITDYRAEVVRAPAGSVANVVESILGAQNARRVGVPAGLRAEWRPGGCRLVDETTLDTAGFDTLDAALTGCTVAIAETGTVVLAAGAEEGRRALTLVPDLHVCVVERAQIVELVPEGVRRAGDLVKRERRPLTFVSGPSATSDIELARVEGVHGPRRLVVVVAEPRAR
jgi:L-lactate dehydrogenase complex protein LldG